MKKGMMEENNRKLDIQERRRGKNNDGDEEASGLPRLSVLKQRSIEVRGAPGRRRERA